jgi:membrane-bound lytic murein transglycosylase D
MRSFLLLLSTLLIGQTLMAQVPPRRESKLLTSPTGDLPHSEMASTPRYVSIEDVLMEEQMRGFVKNYRYANPSSTVYDTLIRNTQQFGPDEVPTYDPQTIADRLYGLPTIIPMDYNAEVQRYIEVYAERKRDLTARVLGLSRVYFPIFEEALDREGMPIELKYLSVVESALNPHAVSRVGATGLWQFMLSTGRMYDLDVNSFVDERKDPYRSTEAALRYLKGSYKEFGDWLLAIASYNCGPGNVRKAIHRSGGKRTFWEIMPYLPRETRGYVPAFIAVNYVFNYASEHNLYPVYVDFTLNQDTLHLRQMDITLAEIAKLTGADVDELRYLNPELKLDRVPFSNETYLLRVPPTVSSYFAKYPRTLRDDFGKRREMAAPRVTQVSNTSSSASAHSAHSSPPSGTKLYYHTVRTGEVVGAIAERYGVAASSVARWNGLSRYRIKVGQKLKIYTTPSRAAAAASPKTTAKPTAAKPTPTTTGAGTYHAVRNGDTLWDIAKRYGVSVGTLTYLNPGLNARDLKVGQAIRVK